MPETKPATGSGSAPLCSDSRTMSRTRSSVMLEKDRWGTIIISQEELDQLWAENDVAAKRASGDLIDVPTGYESKPGDPTLRGARGPFVTLMTPSGQHIGTIHEVFKPDRSFWHSPPHDYVDHDCQKWKRPVKEPPLPRT